MNGKVETLQDQANRKEAEITAKEKTLDEMQQRLRSGALDTDVERAERKESTRQNKEQVQGISTVQSNDGNIHSNYLNVHEEAVIASEASLEEFIQGIVDAQNITNPQERLKTEWALFKDLSQDDKDMLAYEAADHAFVERILEPDYFNALNNTPNPVTPKIGP